MTLHKNLSPVYEYLITTLKTVRIKELTMKYMMVHLMHKMPKRKKNESQDDHDGVVMLQQDKGNNPSFM